MKFIKRLSLIILLLFTISLSFWYISFPQSWQEKFVTNHYEFFFFPTYQWEQHRNPIEVACVKLISLKMGYDWRNKTVTRLKEKEQNSYPFQASVSYLKNHFITQRELGIDVTQTPTYASLIKGFGTCDQINGGLGLLLSSFCETSELIELKNEQLGSHSLVKTSSSLGIVYADAFSGDDVYGFPNELTEEGSKLISSFTEKNLLFNKKEYETARVLTSYNLGAHISNRVLKSNIQFIPPLFYLFYQPSQQKKHYYERPAVMKLYLLARIAHLNGETNLAKKRYQQLIDEDAGLLKDCATLFLKKMKHL